MIDGLPKTIGETCDIDELNGNYLVKRGFAKVATETKPKAKQKAKK